jgi:uncharacterized protein YndB with AHSA1/START domain
MTPDPDRVDVSISVGAPVERVWHLVTDVDLPARFSREFQGGEWLDDPAEGARFRGHNRIGDVEWTTTCTVVDFRPGEAFAWAVESVNDPVAVWGYTLEGSDGGVLLRMHATMGPAPSPPRTAAAADPAHAGEIIARRLRQWTKNMTATVEGIKELAEA